MNYLSKIIHEEPDNIGKIKSYRLNRINQNRKSSFDDITDSVSRIQFKNGKSVLFIGIAGGHASGKRKISEYIYNHIKRSDTICEMSFFKPGDKDRQLSKEDEYLIKDYDFYNKERRLYLIDICSPNSFDYDKFYETLQALREGKKIKIPFFDEEKCEYVPEKDKEIDPNKTPIIIVEGYYIFKAQRLKEMLNLKIYKEVEDDVRLTRLIEREEKYLNNDKEAFKLFFDIYEKFFKISYKENINPFKSLANILLPDNKIFNENNEIEEDETLEFLIRNLTYLSKS